MEPPIKRKKIMDISPIKLKHDPLSIMEMLKTIREEHLAGKWEWQNAVAEHVKTLCDLLVLAFSFEHEEKAAWCSVGEDIIKLLGELSGKIREKELSVASAMVCEKALFRLTALRILESGEVMPRETKLCILRTLTDLSVSLPAIEPLVRDSALLDRIVYLINDEDFLIARQAVQFIKGVAAVLHFCRSLLYSNIGLSLGNLLPRAYAMNDESGKKIMDDVFELFGSIVSYSDGGLLGQQLARSAGILTLLTIYIRGCDSKNTDESRRGHVILMMCSMCQNLLEQFNAHHCIEGLLKMEDLTLPAILMLTRFAQVAWGRVALREKGALSVLISLLAKTTDPAIEDTIATSLRAFAHDKVGLEYIVSSTNYLDVVVKCIKQYLERKRYKCKRMIKDDEEQDKQVLVISLAAELGWSNVGNDLVEFPVYTIPEPSDLEMSCEDLFRGGIYQPCQHACYGRRRAWSPSVSPPPRRHEQGSSELLRPQCSTSSKKSDHDYIDRITFHDRVVRTPKSVPVIQPEDEKVMSDHIFVISAISHSLPVDHLSKTNFIDALLLYVRDAPQMDFKIPRMLRRIAQDRLALEALLKMEFHTRVIHTLLCRECMSNRPKSQWLRHKRWRKCCECSMRAEMGAYIISDFAMSAGSSFGQAVLKSWLETASESHASMSKSLNLVNGSQIKPYIAAVTLARDRHSWELVKDRYKPHIRLLEALRELLIDNVYESAWRNHTYPDSPALIKQILVALSFMLPPDRKHKFLYSCNDALRCCLNEQSSCELMKSCQDSLDTITFRCLGKGHITIPKSALCEGSSYFYGMFAHPFLENIQNCDTFWFDEDDEHCSFELFKQVLHFICGCGRRCVSFGADAKETAAVLHIADRYLCTKLLNVLLADHGPVKYFVGGEAFPTYMEALISNGSGQTRASFRDACMYYLLRFSTTSTMTKALKRIIGNKVAVDIFTDLLEKFLIQHSPLW